MGRPVAHPGRVRITPHGVVRVALGLVLLSAAALKGHQLATEPVAGTGLLTSRWFLIGVVEFELFFGLWLWFGLYPSRTWQLALLCFSTFGCVTFYKAISGEATCGCFGRVPVNPWYTLVLDLAAVTALLRWRPTTSPAPSPRPVAGEGRGVRAGSGRQLACVLGVSVLLALPAALAMASYQAATVDEAGDIFGDSEFVVLEPEKWVGKRFPLLTYMDIGDQLAEGEWLVVMYRHDCPRCQETILKHEFLGGESIRCPDAVQVALVDLPPHDDSLNALASQCAECMRGRLHDVKKWFMTTPLEVELEEGRVTGVTIDGRFVGFALVRDGVEAVPRGR